MNLKSSLITEVDAGPLTDLKFENRIWHISFEKDLYVESYGGWNLIEHNYGAQLIAGSRELEESDSPFEKINNLLKGAICGAISHNPLSNLTKLEFIREPDRFSFELLVNSASTSNWKITHDGKEETDLA